jgi:hypothetical protein
MPVAGFSPVPSSIAVDVAAADDAAATQRQARRRRLLTLSGSVGLGLLAFFLVVTYGGVMSPRLGASGPDEPDAVRSLPGYGPVEERMYAGHVAVKPGGKLFYWQAHCL